MKIRVGALSMDWNAGRVEKLAIAMALRRPTCRHATFGLLLPLMNNDITFLLNAMDQGDSGAASQLLPLVYEELRRLAAQRLVHEKPGQTLDATALVHEAYIRLVKVEQPKQWNGRGHFFAAAAQAMRRIMVEQARARKARDAAAN